MSPKASEVAWGCGIGCAVLLVAGLVAVVGGGYALVKRTTQGFDAAIETRARLDQRFGEPETFVPHPDGAIPPDRLEIFLNVRRATTPTRAAIAGFFSSLRIGKGAARELESRPAIEKFAAALRIGRSAFGFAQDLGKFFEARDRALLDAGMGMGEYTYIYALAYYAWLGHAPDDGPGEVETDTNGHRAEHGGHRSMTVRVHDDVLRMLENQRAALVKERETRAERDFLDALETEIDAMRKDSRRTPWQDGLPVRVAVPLEPFRARLEETYVRATNPFEIARPRRSGDLSITTD